MFLAFHQDYWLLAGIWSTWQGKDNSCRFDEARGEVEPFFMLMMVEMMFDVTMTRHIVNKIWSHESHSQGWVAKRWADGCRGLLGGKHQTKQGFFKAKIQPNKQCPHTSLPPAWKGDRGIWTRVAKRGATAVPRDQSVSSSPVELFPLHSSDPRGWIANEIFRRAHPEGTTIGEISSKVNSSHLLCQVSFYEPGFRNRLTQGRSSGFVKTSS